MINSRVNILIENNIVNNDKYWEAYLALITANTFTEKATYYTNRHHIIPACYFKHFGIEINNNSTNIVNLTIYDHLLAHYYLYKCAAVDWFKLANLSAIIFVKNYSHKQELITDDWISEHLENIASLHKEAAELASTLHINMSGEANPFFGRHHTEETKIKISESKKDPSELVRLHLSLAAKNRAPVSAETLEKRSIALKTAHQNKNSNGYKNVGKKIAATKALNKSGNNRENKIRIWLPETNKTKYIQPAELSHYIELGYIKYLIQCVETKECFISAEEASKKTGINKASIQLVLAKKRNLAGGFHWVIFQNNL